MTKFGSRKGEKRLRGDDVRLMGMGFLGFRV